MAQEPLVRVPALEDEHADLPVRAFLSPPEIFAHIATAGVDKKRAGPVREGVLGLAAGAYIGLGFSLCMNVGGQLSPALRHAQPGLYSLVFSSFGFPFGLTLCVIAGSSLFTSNVGYLTAAVWERRCSVLSAVRVCIYSYFCNALGALALAQLYIWAQVFAGEKAAFVIELAAKKTSNPWSVAFVRGILCNYLVVLAIWQANAAQDVASKAIAIFLPISAFVALGFEHCIANLFGLPLAMFLQNGPGGAEAVASVAAHSFPVPGKVPPTLTAARIVSRNLVPVTLGNIVGGSLFVATAYAFAFGAPGRAADDWVERQWLRFKLAVRRRARQAKVGHQGGGGGGGSGANGSSGRGLLDLHHGSGQQRATNRKAPAAAPAAANGTASAAAAAVLPPVGLTPAANGAIIPPLRTVRISSDGGEP
jgi:formate/nitrite transporter